MNQVSIVTTHDVSYLNERLLNGRYIRLLPASEYEDIPLESLRLWCYLNARYGLPTLELINWLKEIIGNKKCIEIGAGHGDLGRYLDILQTDSKLQDFAPVKNIYRQWGSPIIKYPDSVRKLDALDAVIKYEPEIVIGSWVTQFIDENENPNGREACMWE